MPGAASARGAATGIEHNPQFSRQAHAHEEQLQREGVPLADGEFIDDNFYHQQHRWREADVVFYARHGTPQEAALEDALLTALRPGTLVVVYDPNKQHLIWNKFTRLERLPDLHDLADIASLYRVPAAPAPATREAVTGEQPGAGNEIAPEQVGGDSGGDGEMNVHVGEGLTREPKAGIQDLNPEDAAPLVNINQHPLIDLAGASNPSTTELDVKGIGLGIERDMHGELLLQPVERDDVGPRALAPKDNLQDALADSSLRAPPTAEAQSLAVGHRDRPQDVVIPDSALSHPLGGVPAEVQSAHAHKDTLPASQRQAPPAAPALSPSTRPLEADSLRTGDVEGPAPELPATPRVSPLEKRTLDKGD